MRNGDGSTLEIVNQMVLELVKVVTELALRTGHPDLAAQTGNALLSCINDLEELVRADSK